MGLSIHYKGNLKKAGDLPKLIAEIIDIAKIENWKFHVFEEKFVEDRFSEIIDKENLFGISISVPNCEPLCFSFLSNGKMCGIINYNVMKIDNKIDELLTYSLSTKTQYSGFKNHIKIIWILDYISKKYLENFECIDEGFYWKTRNEELLKKTFEKYSNFIDSFTSSLEMIPKNKNENLEDFIKRLAEVTMINQEKEDDDLPKLSPKEENEFKRMKLALEHDAIFPQNMKLDMPPEIEGQFLDYISNFEKMSKNAKQITVFEKIGKPEFKVAASMTNDEIEVELEKLEELLFKNNMTLDVTCNYENEERLIYTFITEELFIHEINDISIPDMITHFNYEEFHPNHAFDIENSCTEFINMFLDTKNNLYAEYHSEDALNHEALNNFRSLFKKFKILHYEFGEITINDNQATATFNIDFTGKIHEIDTKITYSGDGDMTFKFEFGFWYVQIVNLPIMN